MSSRDELIQFLLDAGISPEDIGKAEGIWIQESSWSDTDPELGPLQKPEAHPLGERGVSFWTVR